MAARKDDPRSVLIKAKKLPISLLVEQARKKKAEVSLLELETYEDTFGPKKKRKRVKVAAESIDELAVEAEKRGEGATTSAIAGDMPKEAADPRLRAGQSKRIWEELYKVLDASDVVCVVLDARDPMGTRVYHVE